MTELDLDDWQLELGGVLLGTGTSIPIAEIDGLGRPDVRGDLVDQPAADGAWPAPDWYAARTVRIDCAVKTPGDPAAARAIVAALQTAADDPDVRSVGGAVMPLRIKWPGSPVKVLFGRVRKLAPSWENAVHGWVPLDIEFAATDPHFHSDTEHTTAIPLGSLSRGAFTAPVQAPIRVGGTGGATARPGWVDNAGDLPAHPVITAHGPCANPAITHAETGRTLELSIHLADGESVRLDTRPGHRCATRHNGGNAAAFLSPASRLDQFVLPPGRSELRWTATAPTTTARLTATWRDAYRAL